MEKLDPDFIPGAFDVICSRGKAAYQHQGNRSFRATLEHHLPSYANARSKQGKTEIVTMIYHGIQEATPEGGFIRKNDKGEWCRVPSHVAREKVGQGFRDLLHTEYRSSTKAKIKRRRDRLYPPTKPPEDEDAGKGQNASNSGSSAGEPIDAKSAPPLGNGKISKSFSYDSEPLPIQVDQSGMAILRQCSFSFVAEKSQDAILLEHDRRDVATQQTGELHHDSSPPNLKGEQSPSLLSSCASSPSAAMTPKRSGSAPLQGENHRTWPGEPVQPTHFYYYQQYASHPSHSYGSRDHGYDSHHYGAERAGSWGGRAFVASPPEDERRRNRAHYPSWY